MFLFLFKLEVKHIYFSRNVCDNLFGTEQFQHQHTKYNGWFSWLCGYWGQDSICLNNPHWPMAIVALCIGPFLFIYKIFCADHEFYRYFLSMFVLKTLIISLEDNPLLWYHATIHDRRWADLFRHFCTEIISVVILWFTFCLKFNPVNVKVVIIHAILIFWLYMHV